MHTETHDNDQVIWHKLYSLAAADLRQDHEIDHREAVTGLAARPGTRNGRTHR